MMKQGPFSDLWVSDNPKIVWDGLGLSEAYSGIGHHAKALYQSLLTLGANPLVTRQRPFPVHFLPATEGLVVDGNAMVAGILASYIKLKPVFPNVSYRHAKTLGQPLIYHGLSNLNLPVYEKKRSCDRFVITVHDLIPLIVDPASLLGLQMRYIMPRILDRADAIIAISSWTKASLVDRFGQHLSGKIAIINNGFEKLSPRLPGDQGEWVLTVARGETYKRLEIVNALALARPRLQFHVVTDRHGERRLGKYSQNVIVHRGVSQEKLDYLYKNSRVMIHPSLYEGWCLPAAEGLTRGLNLVYCAGSGIDEVCRYFPSQSQALVRDSSVNEWIEALDQSLSANPPKTPQESNKMPDWQQVSLETLKIYQNLL